MLCLTQKTLTLPRVSRCTGAVRVVSAPFPSYRRDTGHGGATSRYNGAFRDSSAVIRFVVALRALYFRGTEPGGTDSLRIAATHDASLPISSVMAAQ